MTWLMLLKAFVVWICMLLLAMVNGGLREGLLMKVLNHGLANVLSGVLLSVLIFAVTWWLLPWTGLRSVTALLCLGLAWLIMTVAFEFVFGWMQNKPMAEMLAAYRFNHGNIWPIVLLVLAISPYVVGHYKGWFSG